MSKRRVVITGVGAVTPVGLTAAESWEAVKAGKCGIAPITLFDTTGMKVHLAAEVKGFDPETLIGKQEAKRMSRFVQLALVAAREALANSGFQMNESEADRCGVVISRQKRTPAAVGRRGPFSYKSGGDRRQEARP